jgi:serine/threonine protein kinase
MLREMVLQREFGDNQHIARALDVVWTPTRLYLVLEVMDTSLREVLAHQRDIITPAFVRNTVRGVLHALSGLKQREVLHRDVKPSNILINQHDAAASVKLCDFGTAVPKGRNMNWSVFPLHYMSPEALLHRPDYGYSADIWSLGCILYELYAGAPPFVG